MNTLVIQNASNTLTLYKPGDDNARNPANGIITIAGWSISSYKPRVSVSRRSGRPGGRIAGDRQPDARTIKINLDITNREPNADSVYYGMINAIIGMFREDLAPFYLVDSQNERRTAIDLSDFDDPWENSEMRISSASMTLEMIDGVWENSDATTATAGSGGLTTGGSVSATNTGTITAFPIITATALSDIGTFRLTNSTTGAFTEIESFSFLTGSTYVFDSVDGTVYLDDQESANDLTDGSGLLNLAPGANSIVYTSPDGDIDLDISWRVRYPK